MLLCPGICPRRPSGKSRVDICSEIVRTAGQFVGMDRTWNAHKTHAISTTHLHEEAEQKPLKHSPGGCEIHNYQANSSGNQFGLKMAFVINNSDTHFDREVFNSNVFEFERNLGTQQKVEWRNENDDWWLAILYMATNLKGFDSTNNSSAVVVRVCV